jgi:hypothetical protein
MTTKVPAFDTALGIGDPANPILVDEKTLSTFNEEISTNNKALLRFGPEAAAVASLFAKRAIRPDEIASLRRRMFDVVSNNLSEVEQVLEGKKTWSPTQTRLFALLTERVMPKLTNITVEDPTSKKLEDMTVDELEAIALGKSKAQAIDAVVKEGEVLDKMAERVESRETKRKVIQELATITAIDDAEKKYIAKKIGEPMEEIEKQTIRQMTLPKYFNTPEQREKQRRFVPKKSYVEHMLARGHSMEEALEMEKARQEKIRASKLKWSEVQKNRAARTLNLGDAAPVAHDIENRRRATMKEFKVHGNKGVRTQSSLVKAAERRKEKEAKRIEKAENPRVFVRPEDIGLTAEDFNGEKVRLRRLRELKPDAFVSKPKVKDKPLDNPVSTGDETSSDTK